LLGNKLGFKLGTELGIELGPSEGEELGLPVGEELGFTDGETHSTLIASQGISTLYAQNFPCISVKLLTSHA